MTNMTNMTNKEILGMPTNALHDVGRQDQHLLRMATERNPCGRCGKGHSQLEAQGIKDVNDYDLKASDRTYRCPVADAPIKYIVPFIGKVMFFGDHEAEERENLGLRDMVQVSDEPKGPQDWTEEGKHRRKGNWGRIGQIVHESNSHGQCFEVMFGGGDVGSAHYNPEELTLAKDDE